MRTKKPPLLLFLLLLLFTPHAEAEAKFRAVGQDGTVVTLYDEPCALKEQITNLKFRATWWENGQTFEGCWNLSPFHMVVLYMSNDKTAFVIPAQMFERVSES